MPYEKVWDDIHFWSNDLKIAAYFYTPKDWHPGDPPRPAVVVLHGYTGMKDVYGMDVPQRLWEEGYFVLSYDYPGFGVSEGGRGRHRPLEQAQATYDAVTWLTTSIPSASPITGRVGAAPTRSGAALSTSGSRSSSRR